MYYRYNGERSFNMAAVDIGTNACRLLVSRVNVRPQKRSHLRIFTNPIQWHAIDSFSRIIRLGEDLKKTGKISEKAIQRTLTALYLCYKKICYYRVSHLRVVATEACRQGQNADELVRRARDLYNISIEIVTGQQEAQLALLGCCEIFNWKKEYTLVFDVGGGSTEFALIKLNPNFKHNYLLNSFYEIIDTISLPFGVVTVNDSLQGYTSRQNIFDHVRQKIMEGLKFFCLRNNIFNICNEDNVQLIGSSGTVTAFASIHLGLTNYNRRKVDGCVVPTEKLLELCHKTEDLSIQKEAIEDYNCISHEDLMNVGSGILSGIFESIPVKEVTIADRGVREGMIVDLIRKNIIPNFQVFTSRTASS